MTFDDVRAILLRLPGVTKAASYGTPAFRVGGNLLTRLREPDVLVVHLDMDERDMLMVAEPETFFVTDHYRGYPAMLARLSRAHPGTLERLLVQSWRQAAPKRAVKAYDEQQKETP